jgi:hypothetical protein
MGSYMTERTKEEACTQKTNLQDPITNSQAMLILQNSIMFDYNSNLLPVLK